MPLLIYAAIAGSVLFVGIVSYLSYLFITERRDRRKDAYVYEDRITRLLIQNTEYVSQVGNQTKVIFEEVDKAKAAEISLAERDVKFNELALKYGSILLENDDLVKEVVRWKDNSDKNLSHRKSSETRTGHLVERFAPFLETFPYPADKCSFLGNPIDYVVWDDDAIHFVEVKSGKSALSKKQKKIKELVEAGKVDFQIFRVKE